MIAEALSEGQIALRDYVSQMALFLTQAHPEGFKNDYHQILAEGQFHTAQKKPAQYKYGKRGYCFYNAYQLAYKYEGELTYVEGIALGIIPMHHGWCVDKQGRVVDNTWRTTGNGKFIHKPESLAYYGIPFDLDFLHKIMLHTRRYGVLLGNKW